MAGLSAASQNVLAPSLPSGACAGLSPESSWVLRFDTGASIHVTRAIALAVTDASPSPTPHGTEPLTARHPTPPVSLQSGDRLGRQPGAG